MGISSIDCRRNVPKDLFPFPDARKGQDLFLKHARECVKHGIHLFAHAPTGLGKTAVSMAAALEYVLQNEGILFFLTARQSQHAVAVETAKRIHEKEEIRAIDIIAQEDMCLATRERRIQCINDNACFFSREITNEMIERILAQPLHVQELMRVCLKEGVCPYFAAMCAMPRSDLVVCDYNHFFAFNTRPILDRFKKKISETVIIVDEGHNLPRRIIENHTGILTLHSIQRAVNSKSFKKFREDIGAIRSAFLKILSTHQGDELLSTRELDDMLIANACIDTEGLAREFSKHLEPLDLMKHREIITFLSMWHRFGESSVRYVDRSSKSIVVHLIDPALISKPVFDATRCVIVMSGTLHPPEMFADLLGVKGRCACRRYPSPFPVENRLILAVPQVSSRYRTRSETTYSTMAKIITDISAVVRGNVLCFFTSYDFLDAVRSKLDPMKFARSVLIEKRGCRKSEKEAIITELTRNQHCLVLAPIGGSFSEGVDFKNNIISCVIIAGFPMNPPSIENIAIKDRFKDKIGERMAELYFDIYPAISKVLQAAGRAIRSESDRAVIALLDERYSDPTIKGVFPNDFQIKTFEDPISMIHDFFTAKNINSD
ncbi:MAG: ATP-dependent DNA helicase [Methanomassiliicoccales archaeon]|jgi:DNA excision repair protein ERCC-2|nr:ATP-dependent DNA helicase [Methanomassiliicoccales archaeon]